MTSTLEIIERWTRRVGLLTLLITLVTILWGVWRGMKRPVGQKSGREPAVMRSPAFYILASVGYFGVCFRLWRPLSRSLSRPLRAFGLILGSTLYFPGLLLVLWGRLTLAQMYNVSSGFGAQLYADHQLITYGPYAWVRHPMYLGILLTGLGGLLLYRTWTFLFVLLHFPALVFRARREEEALSAEFGEQWTAYRQRVPRWWPGRNYCSIGLVSCPECAFSMPVVGQGALPCRPPGEWGQTAKLLLSIFNRPCSSAIT